MGTYMHETSEKYFKRCRAKYSQVSIAVYVSIVLWDIFSERLNTWQQMSYRDSFGRDQAWLSLLPAQWASFLPPLLGSGAQDSFPSPQVAAQTPDVFRIFFFSSEVFLPFKDSRMFPYYLSLRNISSLLNLASYHSSYTGQSIDFCRVWSLMEQRRSHVQCVDAWELHCLGVYWLFLHFSKMLYWAVIRILQIGQRPEFDNWLLP